MTNHDAALVGLESLLEFLQTLLIHLEEQLAPPPPPPTWMDRLRRLVTGRSLAETYRRTACRVIRYRVGRMTAGLRERVLADLEANAEALSQPFEAEPSAVATAYADRDATDEASPEADYSSCHSDAPAAAGAAPFPAPAIARASPRLVAGAAGIAVSDASAASRLALIEAGAVPPAEVGTDLLADASRADAGRLPSKAVAPWLAGPQRQGAHWLRAPAPVWFFVGAAFGPAVVSLLPPRRVRWGEARGPDHPHGPVFGRMDLRQSTHVPFVASS